MVFLLAASQRDPAARNIVENLLRLHPFRKEAGGLQAGNIRLVIFKGEVVEGEEIEEEIDGVEAVAFASRHESRSLQATLTIHTPGLLSPGQLAHSWPQRMKVALKVLSRLAPSGFRVSLEATHHGPAGLKVPAWFVEIGSSMEQWLNREAGRAAAEALWQSLMGRPEGKPAVGFGGGHYAPKHTKATLKGEYAVGHIFPKYALNSLTREIVEEAFEKTRGGCRVALLDWKGIPGEARRRLAAILEELKVEVVKV